MQRHKIIDSCIVSINTYDAMFTSENCQDQKYTQIHLKNREPKKTDERQRGQV